MKELKKSAYPSVTLHTTGSTNKDIVKSAHGKFYLKKNGKLYGKEDGINGYSSANILKKYI